MTLYFIQEDTDPMGLASSEDSNKLISSFYSNNQ
jgi:hypothetical protein